MRLLAATSSVASVLRAGLDCHRLGSSKRARTKVGPVTGFVTQKSAVEVFSFSILKLRQLAVAGVIEMTSPAQTHGLRMYDLKALEALRKEVDDAASTYALTRRLGFPSIAVGALHEAGLIDRVSEAATASIGAIAYSIRSVDLLEATLRAKASLRTGGPSIPLWESLAALPMRHRPWPSILQLLLSGRFAFGIDPDGRKLADMILVPTGMPLARLVIDGSIRAMPPPAPCTIATFEEIWTTIRARAENVAGLRELGLLPEGTVSWGNLRGFLQRYVTLKEANERTSWRHMEGRNVLARHGIHPLHTVEEKGRRPALIYDRTEVGPFMAEWIDPDIQDV
ncbi:hypothetical protein D3218_07700 [Aureimonas flava]|uniref:Uncharacterized protein n=1 Tax=Aureimonas flava TaxID=2320271 RepID=A0A3A1WMM6_9HYPH|nr:hypothetical protein D3218_07700 [Aureimonas flava]